MEYRHGKGMILFCQMDVTGRTDNAPAATHLVGNMLRYVNEWKPETKRAVAGFGDTEAYLKMIGANPDSRYFSKRAIPDFQPDIENTILVTAGGFPWSVADDESVKRFVRGWGGVLTIGCDDMFLNLYYPDITVTNGEYISTYFEPFGMDSPLRGIGPADLHNRDPRVYSLVTDGADVVGNGILAVMDEGRTVICGLAPWQFPEDQQSFKRTFRRSAFTLARLLGNMNADLRTPLPSRFHGQVGKDEKRWLDGLYLDQPEEWDDPYRFFRW